MGRSKVTSYVKVTRPKILFVNNFRASLNFSLALTNTTKSSTLDNSNMAPNTSGKKPRRAQTGGKNRYGVSQPLPSYQNHPKSGARKIPSSISHNGTTETVSQPIQPEWDVLPKVTTAEQASKYYNDRIAQLEEMMAARRPVQQQQQQQQPTHKISKTSAAKTTAPNRVAAPPALSRMGEELLGDGTDGITSTARKPATATDPATLPPHPEVARVLASMGPPRRVSLEEKYKRERDTLRKNLKAERTEATNLRAKLQSEQEAATLGWKLLWNQKARIQELEQSEQSQVQDSRLIENLDRGQRVAEANMDRVIRASTAVF